MQSIKERMEKMDIKSIMTVQDTEEHGRILISALKLNDKVTPGAIQAHHLRHIEHAMVASLSDVQIAKQHEAIMEQLKLRGLECEDKRRGLLETMSEDKKSPLSENTDTTPKVNARKVELTT